MFAQANPVVEADGTRKGRGRRHNLSTGLSLSVTRRSEEGLDQGTMREEDACVSG